MNWFKLIPSSVWLGLGAILLMATLYGFGYVKGGADHKAEAQKAALKGVENHAKIEREVMGLNDHDLDDRLSKWMRD